MSDKIGVIGLGYVGLPVALAFAKKFPGTIGFDINAGKVKRLKEHNDATGEVDSATLKQTELKITDRIQDLKDCTFFVVAVPTPIDSTKRPDLEPLVSSSKAVGSILKKGDVVVYESTVYPGVTEDICGPILAKTSGLVQGRDFKLGYSPERINPGDKLRTIDKIVKVVSGEDDATAERVASAYGRIVPAGIHRASSIKVAEAAKVIENTQRDLNIALMNELAIMFDRLGISTTEVLEAAGTKWNFLPFRPGLVGGHCIGVDPYYLTTKAEEIGYHPQVILAGRRINDSVGVFVAQKTIKMMINQGIAVAGARIGVFGLTFKEDVRDIRNSRVPDIIAELRSFKADVSILDPLADAEETHEEYGLKLTPFNDAGDFDAVVVAVGHEEYKRRTKEIIGKLKPTGVLVDVKSIVPRELVPAKASFWRL